MHLLLHMPMLSFSLTPARKAVKAQRRTQRASRNPLKALSRRADVQDVYTEQIQGVAERELKRIKTEQSMIHHFIEQANNSGSLCSQQILNSRVHVWETFKLYLHVMIY